ncbi:DUF421 domain-containing protein [Mucilaginibacter sp. Bleaf8]|uniref:DUF421 domain-containing protein n=1 Tax=Mucilaginibacter sp. Bleaf8 TaxID=2834430 RepID=UPI001BD1801C|nr:YetF domain-containing protein [Mucilaginibacter sp. Bleaf8]MBS7564060.1 DUF421 domain-containing protein [Mucilaginibacter sp. Bleaf8]
MKKEEIHLEDIQRILFGQAPPMFLLEVFIRTIIIYILMLVIVRWLGKRMSGQLTIMEMAVMLTLGAIVSVPMQMPDRGLLQGLLLLLIAVLFQRGLSLIGYLSGRIEDIVQGKCSLLVKDGVLQLKQMESDRISRQQVFAQLREKEIYNLGNVDRLYLEACGMFSIFRSDKPRAGLPILPPDDKDMLDFHKQSTDANLQHITMVACINCGFVKRDNEQVPCQDCGHNDWAKAIN